MLTTEGAGLPELHPGHPQLAASRGFTFFS